MIERQTSGIGKRQGGWFWGRLGGNVTATHRQNLREDSRQANVFEARGALASFVVARPALRREARVEICALPPALVMKSRRRPFEKIQGTTECTLKLNRSPQRRMRSRVVATATIHCTVPEVKHTPLKPDDPSRVHVRHNKSKSRRQQITIYLPWAKPKSIYAAHFSVQLAHNNIG